MAVSCDSFVQGDFVLSLLLALFCLFARIYILVRLSEKQIAAT